MPTTPQVFALLAAAGSGLRLGGTGPKALATLGGRTIYEWSLRNLCQAFPFEAVVVTTPPGTGPQFARLTQRVRTDLDATNAANALNSDAPATRVSTVVFPKVLFVPGGASRQASVYAGLQALRQAYPQLANLNSANPDSANPDSTIDPQPQNFVLVHDAARAFTPPEVFTRVIAALTAGAPAVTPVLPSTDTIKKVHLGPSALPGTELVAQTLQRTDLRRVQTPQGFPWDVLWEVHTAQAAGGLEEAGAALDDCTMVEAAGRKAYCVPGDELAFKITTPWDFKLASAILPEL